MAESKSKQPWGKRVFLGLVSLAVPLVLVLGTVRLMMNPWFVEFEYRTPGFPADPYGMTFEERLQYSKIAIEYLVNDADISYLADLRFPEGQVVPAFSCQFMDDCNKMYNDRELKHMLDVKIVVQNAMRVLMFCLVFLLVAGVGSWRAGRWQDFRFALRRGGFLTLPFIGSILLLTLLAFGTFFVFFHDLFFAAGTWTFYFSDTLIRMFPERFWRDTFLMAGLVSGLGGLVFGFVLKPR